MLPKRAVIFSNGELQDVEAVRVILTPEDYLIAVDGGLKHFEKFALRPHLLIGDMDSVKPSRLKKLRSQPIEILRYPADKDETDLELAVLAALGRGFRTILIIAATGGRLDQTLGNLGLLSRFPENISARMESGSEEVMLCRDCVMIEGQPDDLVSLIAWGMPAKGVTTSGLKFPLKNETLYPDQTRGISNIMLFDHAEIRITQGNLLCIHTRTKKGKK